MRNVLGAPAEGPDFFDRPIELARLRESLAGSSVLLTAPRRVGKTSLVLRLLEEERRRGAAVVFLNAEGLVDELAFAERLVDGLAREKLHAGLLERLGVALHRLRASVGGARIGGAGVEVALPTGDESELGTLGRAVETVFRRIEGEDRRVLIAIDELPEFLHALLRLEDGEARVRQFLHWLRALRQEHRRHVRWLFLGSIGLDGFVDGRGLAKAINDLDRVTIGALDADEADRFLERLGRSNDLPLPPQVRARIVERLGWPLPHHLQTVFHAMKDMGLNSAADVDVEAVFEHALAPHNYSQFDSWRHRLDEQFDARDARIARAVLKRLCADPNGATRESMSTALVSSSPSDDPVAIFERLGRVLHVLLRDGYLIVSGGHYSFRSFLLREYWHRRELR